MSSFNGYQGELVAAEQSSGCFAADLQIMDLIQNAAKDTVEYIERIGIYGTPGERFKLNNVEFELGKTGIYEARDTEITSIKFIQNSSSKVTIDFIVHI